VPAWLILCTSVFYTSVAASGTYNAPDVSFRTLSGDTLSLQALRGKPVFLSFWSTSCVICIKEMPQLIRLYHALEARGVSMVSITMPYDPPNHVVEMAAQFELPFPVAIDLDGSLMQAFEIQGTPVKMLISAEGGISQTFLGALDFEKTVAAVDSLLAR